MRAGVVLASFPLIAHRQFRAIAPSGRFHTQLILLTCFSGRLDEVIGEARTLAARRGADAALLSTGRLSEFTHSCTFIKTSAKICKCESLLFVLTMFADAAA